MKTQKTPRAKQSPAESGAGTGGTDKRPNPRPKLTGAEWKRVKVKCAQTGKSISEFTADALRAALKAKP